MGDMFQAPNFCIHVMDSLVDNCKTASIEYQGAVGASDGAINYVFSHTTDKCALRRLVIDNAMSQDISYKALPDVHHAEALLEFYHAWFQQASVLIHSRSKPIAVWDKALCTYHSHQDKTMRYTCSTAKRKPTSNLKVTPAQLKDRFHGRSTKAAAAPARKTR